MGEVFPKPIWFDDEHFLELEISFWGPKPTRWRLDKKIYEHEYSVTIADGHTKTKDRTGSQPGNKPDRKGGERPDGDNSGGSRGDKDPREVNHDRGGACREESREACAVYTCSRIEDPDPDDTNEETSLTPPKIGIMKIRLQYFRWSFSFTSVSLLTPL